MTIVYEVRHATRGRIRLHVPALRKAEGLSDALAAHLMKAEGVTDVRLNPMCASVCIGYDAGRADVPPKLEKALREATLSGLLAQYAGQQNGHKESSNNAVNGGTQAAPTKKDLWHPLALPSTSLALSLLPGSAGLLLGLPLIGYNAIPIFKRAFHILRNEHRLNVDFLDSLAITISALQGNLFTGAFMTWLISLGDWIRDSTAAKSKRAIHDLLDYQGKTAWVMRGKKKVELPVSEIAAGDVVVVYAGGMIPVDGEVLKGNASVDQKTITGESLPVERRPGQKVYAATVVREGKLYLRAERVGTATTAAQIVHLVESAPVGETRIQNYAEKFADRLVAPSLAVAGGMYLVSADLNRLLSMVIVDYGTGIRVAAPTSVMAAMTHAARQGILIKGGSYLEKLNKIDTIIFDKTGTLTQGTPRVLGITSFNERRFPKPKILALAAAAEARLKHPVAEAILKKAHEMQIRIPERTESQYHIGLGVEVQVNGYRVQFGSERFLRDRQVKIDCAQRDLRHLHERGRSSLLLAVDGELEGMIPYADVPRPESPAVVKTLHNRGIKNLVMLTGDNSLVAQAVASQLGLNRFFSNVLPAEKAEIVQQLQQQGQTVAMVGDGINDSPALSFADVGISLKNGAEVAQEAADIVLMEENLWKLISAFDISKEAIDLIKQNYAIIAALNTLAFALAIPRGIVSPDLTALISNGSAILASLNAIRPIIPY